MILNVSQVDGTHGSAVAGLTDCMIQARQADAAAGVESRRETACTISMPTGRSCPENVVYDNGFKEQWEMFIRHVCEDAPYKYTPARRRQGRATRRMRAEELEKERRWIDVAPIVV